MFGILIFKWVCNCSSHRILGPPYHQISLFLLLLIYKKKIVNRASKQSNLLTEWEGFTVWLQPLTHKEEKKHFCLNLFIYSPLKWAVLLKNGFILI